MIHRHVGAFAAWVVRGVGPPPPVLPEATDDVVRALEYHRLAGLAAHMISELDAPGYDELLYRLQPDYAATALHTAVLLETRERSRRILAQAGVPSLALKGAGLLAAGVYPVPGTRAMEDVDLLVRPRDAERAVDALCQAGFHPWSPWDPRRMHWLSAFTLDDPRAPAGLRSTVDLHWRASYADLRHGDAPDSEAIWRGADLETGCPAPEPHFVLLVQHLIKHLRVVRHLRGLADLSRVTPLLRDQGALASAAEEADARRSVALLVETLLGPWNVPVPEGIAEAWADPSLRPAVERYLSPERLVAPHRPDPGRWEGLRMRWALMGESPVADLHGVLFPDSAWLRSRYPTGGLRRVRYLLAVTLWMLGVGPSPLSPNQDVNLG